MGRVTQRMRINVELQGFVGLSDGEILDIYDWLRVGPLVAALWTSAGVVAESPAILWALVPLPASGALLPRRSFDAFVLRRARPRLGLAVLPAQGAPRRFACALLCGTLIAGGAGFALGATDAARLLGVTTVLVMAVQAVTGYCVPAALYCRLRRLVVVED